MANNERLMLEIRWDKITAFMQEKYKVTSVAKEVFLDPLIIEKVENSTVYLLVTENQPLGMVNLITKKYKESIQNAVYDMTGCMYEICISEM